MIISIQLNGVPQYLCDVEDLADIETAAAPMLGGSIPVDVQAQIDATYGTLATRQQHRTNYQNRLSQLNAAINATNNPLPDATVANLAALNVVIARLNTVTNILNVILRVLRYVYLHQDD